MGQALGFILASASCTRKVCVSDTIHVCVRGPESTPFSAAPSKPGSLTPRPPPSVGDGSSAHHRMICISLSQGRYVSLIDPHVFGLGASVFVIPWSVSMR